LWIIIVLAGLAVLLVFFLSVPLDIILQAEVYDKPKVRLRFSWLFGLVKRDITEKKEKRSGEKVKATPEKKHRRGDIRLFLRIIKTKGVLRLFKELLKDLLSCFNLRNLVAEFRIGLGDPATTGLLFIFIGPVIAFLRPPQVNRVFIEPSFDADVVFQGYSNGTVSLQPIRLVPPVMKATFSMTTIRIAGILISNRWKRRKQ
jgi:hypothetical protein